MNINQEFIKLKEEIAKYVNYHRFAKKLNFRFYYFLLNYLLSIAFMFYLFVEYPKINDIFINFLSKYFPESLVQVYTLNFGNFLNIELKYLVIEGRFPSNNDIIFSIFLWGSIGLFLYILREKILPFFMWYVYFLIPIIFSIFFFLFFYHLFPYTIREFSILYFISNYGMSLFFIILISISVSVLAINWWITITNFIFLFLCLVYYVLFTYLRYFVFLIILNSFSYLYMASLFFTFGPLLDFTIFVFFYSFYLSFISKIIYKDNSVWRFMN